MRARDEIGTRDENDGRIERLWAVDGRLELEIILRNGKYHLGEARLDWGI